MSQISPDDSVIDSDTPSFREPSNQSSHGKLEARIDNDDHVITPPQVQAPLRPHQHMSIMYLSFIEGQCEQKALESLNGQRDEGDKLHADHPKVRELCNELFEETVQTFSQNGMIPTPQFAGSDGAEIRKKYRDGFDTALGKIAKTKFQSLGSNENSVSIGDSMPGSLMQKAITVPSANISSRRNIGGSSAPELMLGESQNLFAEKSQFAEEYIEERFLGKGGYGKVVQVRSILDNCQYAVKSILISSQRLRKFQDMAQIEALLMELRTLAKLNHTNIVRYYHGWIERYTAQPALASNQQRLLEAENTQTSFSSTGSLSGPESMRATDLNGKFSESAGLGIKQLHEDIQDDDDGIVFGYSSMSQALEDIPIRKRRVSQATASSALTLKTSIESIRETETDEGDDIESIPRSRLSQGGWSSAEPSTVPLPTTQRKLHDQYLYIKMSLHPLTLSKYIASEPPKSTDVYPIRHCFHSNVSAKILLAILDGIDYLHSQRIVHRDLKPANIFLSIQEGRCPSLTGSVNVTSCSECPAATPSGNFYITPCIGDFGLIAEIRDDHLPKNEPVPSEKFTYKPSPLAELAPKPVGTQFYRPPAMPSREPYICEKLDVFSLGVMAFELVNQFTTGFERVDLLGRLNKGNLPLAFEHHPFARGVKGMTRLDRDERWDCKKVRKWLEDLLKNER